MTSTITDRIIYDVPKHVLVASICYFLGSCYIVL